MKVRYNYRLKPSKEQENLLYQFIGQQRFVWNHFLAKEIETYKETKKFNFYNHNSAELPKLKKEFDWLSICPSQAHQQTLKDLNNALTISFRRKDRGFPKFKKKKYFEGSFRLVQTPDLWQQNKKQIKLPKLGWMKWIKHRELPSTFSTAAIFLDGKKWYISIVVELKEREVKEIVESKQIAGLDLNSAELVVTSDGQVFKNQKYLKKSKRKLKKIQRQFAKLKKGSKRRRKKQLTLRKAYKKVTNQRKDHLHKISNQITNDYDLICTEDLNVKGIQRFKGSIVQDAGWSILISQLIYKCRLKGKTLVQIDRFAPSSKACNSCGLIKEDLTLADRVYNCKGCGNEMDRDLNAAMNIRDWGIQKYTGGTPGITHGRGDTSVGVEKSARYVSLNRQKFLGSKRVEEATESSGSW